MNTKNTLSHYKKIYRSLSPRHIIYFWVSVIFAILFFLSGIIAVNRQFLITIPAYGGEIHEGISGTPRFINPVLATSVEDKDLTSLIFAGITKKDSEGNFILDMGENIEKSDDGLSYTIHIKKQAHFHNGDAVTSDDIIYTINLIQNPKIKSLRSLEWEGIHVDKIDDNTIHFTLKKEYPLFLEALSVGILPKKIWKELSDEQFSLSDYNIQAIGSGPYSIENIEKVSGIPTLFTLSSHEKYTLGRPYIDTLYLHIYNSDTSLISAYNYGEVERISSLSKSKINTIKNIGSAKIMTASLPRVFSVFLNPNKMEYLSDKNIRKALSLAIDRSAIIQTIYGGHAHSLLSPFPFETKESPVDLIAAKKLLENSKYYKTASSSLEITLTTSNSQELRDVAYMLKNNWEALGIKTTVLVYEASDINQNIVKERNFQTLLYGSLITHPSDVYAFYHSSQRVYPGLNISSYVSKKVDDALLLLRSSDLKEQKVAYEFLQNEFEEEVPNIFLYSPQFIYISKDKAHIILPNHLTESSERFTLIHSWYIKEERVWKTLYKKNIIELLQNSMH